MTLAHLVRLGRWHGPDLNLALKIAIVGYLAAAPAGNYGRAACTLPGFAMLIPAAALADLHGKPSFWRHPLLVRLGELSFAFYMVHIRILHLATHVAMPNRLVGITAVSVVALAVSWLVFECVERPARHWLLKAGARANTSRRIPPDPVAAEQWST